MYCSFSSGRKRTRSCCTAGEVKMAREASSMTLPEELVEKIVAMMPFPTLFKARCLSKSWLTRFEPISSQKDATRFQKQVAEWSNRWDTFCHLYVDNEKLIGFNQTFQNRVTLPSLSFLPGKLFRASSDVVGQFFSSRWGMYRLNIEGALLYWTWGLNCYPVSWIRRTSTERLYVANILTRQYKQLPPRPKADLNIVEYRKLISDPSGEAYKMIVFCIDVTEEEEGYCAQIYDSKLETWSSVENAFRIKYHVTSVGLDGVLYMLSADNVQNLLAFNLEQRTLTRLPLSFNDVVQFNHLKLVVCNSILVVIGIESASNMVRVLKIDLQSLRLWQVALFCPGAFKLIKRPVEANDTNQLKLQEGGLSKSENIPPDLGTYCENREFNVGMLNCNFFEIGTSDGRMLAYNQHKDEWHPFCFSRAVRPLGSIYFQPGLNPFMPV